MTGTNCDLFTYNQSRSYLNHLVIGNMNIMLLSIYEFRKNRCSEESFISESK